MKQWTTARQAQRRDRWLRSVLERGGAPPLFQRSPAQYQHRDSLPRQREFQERLAVLNLNRRVAFNGPIGAAAFTWMLTGNELVAIGAAAGSAALNAGSISPARNTPASQDEYVDRNDKERTEEFMPESFRTTAALLHVLGGTSYTSPPISARSPNGVPQMGLQWRQAHRYPDGRFQ